MFYVDPEESFFRWNADNIKDPESFEAAITDILSRRAPVIDQNNFEQLCTTKHVRKYCLVLVDATPQRVQKTIQELEESKKTYEEDSKEMEEGSGDDFVREEPFQIQVVTLVPYPPLFSRSFPCNNWSEFHDQEAIGSAEAFIIEDATFRGKSLGKFNSFVELYQMLAYEDLLLQNVGSIQRHLPDPEGRIADDLYQAYFGSFLHALMLFLCGVIVAAILPELPKENVVAFFIIAPPVLCLKSAVFRKYLALYFV